MQTTLLPQRLDAQFAATEASAESRTVPMVFYSGATVLQFNWESGIHELTLSMEDGAVDLSSMNSGRAPFTLGHADPNNPLATLGVIDNARVEKGKARADVRFSKRPDVDPIFADVIDRILQNVSVGAKLKKIKEVTQKGAKMRSFIATKWAPFAVALVGVGADPNAHFAAAEVSEECEIEFADRATGPKENVMDSVLNPTVPGAGAQPVINEAQLKQAIAQSQQDERSRAAAIRKMVITGKLDAALADTHIAAGTTVEAFREVAFEALAARSEQNPTQTHRAEITRDEAVTFRDGMVQALLDRGGVETLKDGSVGVEFRGTVQLGLMRMAEEAVRRMGKNPDRMNKMDIARFGLHSTSDLPYILQTAAAVTLATGYAQAPATWQKIAARRTATDFNTQRDVALGMTANMPQVGENGEYKYAKLTDSENTWAILRYGNIIGINREVIINDRLGVITDVPRRMGLKAGIKQANLVWAVLTANAALADGVALFHATHANLTASGTAISVDSLGVGVKTMGVQTDQSSDYIEIEPRYLLVPKAKEQLAKQYTSVNYQPTANSGVNPYAGTMEVIANPRLDADSATAWYLVADPNLAPVLIYGYLDGNEGVRLDSEPDFDTDGLKLKVAMEFGAGAIDYRGIYKNVGA